MRWQNEPLSDIDVVAFGAHPDDVELHAGGTIARLTAAGQKVVLVDATEGEMSSNGDVPLRRKETEQASAILGLSGRVNLQLRDGFLSDEKNLVEILVKLLRSLKPTTVLMSVDQTRHPDHAALSRAVHQSIFFMGVHKAFPEVKSAPRPIHVLKYHEAQEIQPDCLIDISKWIEIKKKALTAYQSQFTPKEGDVATLINGGFVERVLHRNRLWGGNTGVEYAEPFSMDVPPLFNPE